MYQQVAIACCLQLLARKVSNHWLKKYKSLESTVTMGKNFRITLYMMVADSGNPLQATSVDTM